jgi:hypothetical protein
MESKKEFLVETDLLLEYLTHNSSGITSLEKAMTKGICFTTVINASELFFAASTDLERKSVQDLLASLKILGLNSRYSLKISKFFNKVATTRDAIMCVVAEINKLPILTSRIDRYKQSGIKIIDPLEL